MQKVLLPSVVATISLGLLTYGLIAADKKTAQEPSTRKIPATDAMPLPEYNDDGALLRPTGYEKWIVVGTSVGLGYEDGDKTDPSNPGQFHNVYLQREAFDHFVETGEFPEQTVFVVTNLPSRSTKKDKEKNDVLRAGFFAAPTAGLEVSVKDTKRFPDGWGYYMFRDQAGQPKGKVRDAEQPFARKACYDCHAEHGAVDHVFTQYYSVLTEAREKHLTEKK